MAQSPFVTTAWLADNARRDDIAIVDASWHLPDTGRDPHDEYAAGHIPGAVFFDIDAVADRATDLPHMLPSPDAFAEAAGTLGISETMTIVVYDEAGLFSAPRAWWSFRVMGAKDVRILAGGGPRWRAEGRALEQGWPSPRPQHFEPGYKPELVADFSDIGTAINHGTQILDARPAARFSGQAPEPRPNLRSGHIPASHNLPASSIVQNGEMLAPDQLRDAVKSAGIDASAPVITTCGSGVTAATLALALEVLGARDVALYDGSWAEWGGRPDTRIELTSS